MLNVSNLTLNYSKCVVNIHSKIYRRVFNVKLYIKVNKSIFRPNIIFLGCNELKFSNFKTLTVKKSV